MSYQEGGRRNLLFTISVKLYVTVSKKYALGKADIFFIVNIFFKASASLPFTPENLLKLSYQKNLGHITNIHELKKCGN